MPAAAVDLTTVAAVKAFLPQANSTADDTEIQALVTACSQYAVDWCGRSSLNSSAQYTEIRNGNGSERMYTRNDPITAISSVQVNGFSIPISAGYNQQGAAISENQDAIVLMPFTQGNLVNWPFSPYWQGPLVFYQGVLNVQLVYTAGYSAAPTDLAEACSRLVAQQYMRRQTIDQKSKVVGMSGAGSTTINYQSWWAEPWFQRVLQKYRRIALFN